MKTEGFSSRTRLSSNRHSRARGNPGLVTVELALDTRFRGYDGIGTCCCGRAKHDLHDIFEGAADQNREAAGEISQHQWAIGCYRDFGKSICRPQKLKWGANAPHLFQIAIGNW
jgi:hypothetical protein